jgi:hypothetical protein
MYQNSEQHVEEKRGTAMKFTIEGLIYVYSPMRDSKTNTYFVDEGPRPCTLKLRPGSETQTLDALICSQSFSKIIRPLVEKEEAKGVSCELALIATDQGMFFLHLKFDGQSQNIRALVSKQDVDWLEELEQKAPGIERAKARPECLGYATLKAEIESLKLQVNLLMNEIKR